MGQDEILQLLRTRPFEPFRMFLSNNQTNDVRHPDMAIATPSAVFVGIPASSAPKEAAQEVEFVSLHHVVKVEFLGAVAASGSSGSSK